MVQGKDVRAVVIMLATGDEIRAKAGPEDVRRDFGGTLETFGDLTGGAR